MAENNRRRKVRSESMALDAMHIIISIADDDVHGIKSHGLAPDF